jgi:protein TonB
LYPEEDLPPESGPCVIELGDQDSSFFHTDVEPHLEWGLEPYDSAVHDVDSTSAFLDWIVPADPEPVDSQTHMPEIVLDDVDLEGGLSQSSPQWGVVEERLRCLATGFVIHFCCFSLFLAVPNPSQRGLGGISSQPIFVRLPITVEIDTPDIPSRASVDSLASAASLARRHPKPEEFRKEQAAELEPKKVSEQSESEPRPVEAKPAEDRVLAHAEIPPDISLREGPPNDSKSLQDSIASAPSVARPEIKGALKAGNETENYDDRILSAIHQAAYYPRAALRKMVHGQAVVSFTINKDGSLANVSIERHAESEILDEAALKIVQQASSHFPPIPDELMKDQVTYVVPIVFKKKG